MRMRLVTAMAIALASSQSIKGCIPDAFYSREIPKGSRSNRRKKAMRAKRNRK